MELIVDHDETYLSEHEKMHEQQIRRVQVDSKKRPIYGILTEPLRGNLNHNGSVVDHFEEYIPAAHVQFLEQAAVKVVPISFKQDPEALINKLSQVNGIYLSGDS